MGAAACASLSGLNDIPLGEAEGGTSGHGADSGDVAAPPGGDDGAVPDGQAIAPDEASGSIPETGVLDQDSAAAPVDANADAAAVCRAQCSGCCDPSGTCHGGQSSATCGSGGLACRDCASTGMGCASGACVAQSPADSGTPTTCVVTKCTNSCPLLPLAEAPCCKSDNTCGCGAVLGILLCN
jgi:hypothetical protein